MEIIQLGLVGSFVVVVVAISATSVLNLRNVLRGLGPNRPALRIQAIALGMFTLACSTAGIAALLPVGLGPLALLALPLVGAGLVFIRTGWKYR